MNAIEKIKLTKQLNAKVDERNVLTSALAKLKLSRVIEELREKLGLSNGDSKAKETGYADVLVRDSDGKLLLVQRKADDSFKPNHWWIAGGHIENNETAEDAAIRELKEETGINANNVKFLNTKVVDDGKVSHRFTYITDSQDVKLQKDELSDFAWVTIEDAKNYQLVGEYSDLKSLYEKAQNLIELNLPENPSHKDLANAVNKWLKDNAQGKIITASNGTKIRFNANNSTKHLTFDGRQSILAAKSITYVIDVFETGVYVGKQELYKDRTDDFVAFHSYRKWVEIDGYKLYLEAKAGERSDGSVIALDGMIAYSQKIIKKESQLLTPSDENIALDGIREFVTSSCENNTTILDDIQAENETLLTILEVTDLNGNPIDLDQETQSSATPDSVPNKKAVIRQAYQFEEGKTKSQRQKDNNAVFDLLDSLERGDINAEELSNEQKAVLAKYSGSGGGLKSRDGKTGSAHEYYTPAPVAEAMWKAIEEMGFNGGQVLDPCAGSGIFGAFAPESAVVQAVEMDETSAKVNELVNGGENYHVDVASFEERAQSIPDHSVDAIVTNVPFGDVSLRKHRHKDSKYQKENLQTYFVLRSLDKLKYGGLAAFIVPASFLDAKGGKASNARVMTSKIAEFIGAYRLPNSVFGTAAADVATDILFYRKYSREVIAKIEELQAQNPEILVDANVMWDAYLDGRYFKLGENKKYIFGEEGEIESWRTDANGNKKKVYAVLNNDSVSNIAKAIQRFQGSCINWALLDEVETVTQSYEKGDVIYQNGQAYEFNGITFDAVNAVDNQAESRANEIVALLDNPLMAFENKVKAADMLSACLYYFKTNNSRHLPEWVATLSQDIFALPENIREQQFRRVLVGLSVQYVMDNFGGNNQLNDYPELSDAMKAHVALNSKLNRYKKANEAIKLHYNTKQGYSKAWQGITKEIQQELSVAKKVEQIKYLNGTLALPIETVRELGIDPLQNDDWCVNADGSEATKADDYFVGNLKDVLDKIDADFANATNEEVKKKLNKMRKDAFNRVTKVNTENMKFSLRSPFVSDQLVLRFVQSKVSKLSSISGGNARMSAFIDVNENGKSFINIDGSHNTREDMLLKRIGAYLKNGTISHQGMKFTTPLENGRMWETREMTDAEKLKFIREEVVRWNAEFDTWLKADAQFMRDIAERANAPENLQFAKVDDESEVLINNASGEFKLHGYQNAFVRKSAREFSGINSFGVGLGKTATALASAQYALETGTKKKVCFIVPNAVLSNWNKESGRFYNESEKERCLFVGADVDKNGDFVVNSKNYARDLNVILENKHNKIFMTQQAFEKIRLRTETAENYIAYMSKMDNAFAESQNAAKDEKAKAKGANLAADIAGNNKLDNAPYFEDLGIDALIVDEAHHFKNAKQALKVARVKGLPSGKPSARAIDMGVKSWVIRNGNVRKDGVILLTATPVTNSPLEVYAMMSLAVGEERIKQAFLGNINGADDFIEAICEIQNQEENNMANETVSVQALIGIKNLELVKNLIQTNADVKEAKDVGMSFKQVESEDVSDGVYLDSATKRAVNRYQNAYRIARLKLNGRDFSHLSQIEMDDYYSVLEEVGSVEKTGHPFSMVKRISNALLDLELNSGKTYYTVKDIKAAKRAVAAFNDAKRTFTFETENEPDDVDLIVKIKNIKTDNGDKKQIFVVKAVATLEDNQVILSCNEFNAQLKLETLLDSENADVSVSISPKVAALIENVKKEQAHIRYTQADGTKPKFAKQIIFVESLAMHTKIKRLLAKEAGIPAERITFISGQFNSDPDEIIDVQESFNADGDTNKYSIVIANKKAEVGINLQKGCQAIHHLELNWTPDSITQRNGRGVRQGNTAEKVNVYFYEVDGTFDSYKRTAINRKSNWIEQVMSKADGQGNFAEVGQGLTDQDYDEMINFDGSAAQFQKMLQRQNARKQAEIDRATLQSQQVNIDLMMSANSWLRKNPDLEKFLKEKRFALVEAGSKLADVRSKWLKSIEKNAKSIEKNKKEYDRTLAQVRAFAAQFNGILSGYNLPMVREEMGESNGIQFPIFRIDYNFFGDVEDYSKEIPVIAEYYQERDKQLALRESAAKNAMNAVNTPQAVPAMAIEMIRNGEDPIIYQGGYLPKNTIVTFYDDRQSTYFILSADRIIEITNNNHSSINRSMQRVTPYGNPDAPIQMFTPDSENYLDGIKLLAELETKLVRHKVELDALYDGYKIYYDISKYSPELVAPSLYLDDVIDFLPDDVKAIREKGMNKQR